MSGLMGRILVAICLLGSVPAWANGYEKNSAPVVAMCITGVLAVGIVFWMFLKNVKKMKNEILIRSMSDMETGMGNRAYFVRRFNNDISDVSRRNYFVAYLIVDSNYLWAYSTEFDFKEVIKYTAEGIKGNLNEYDFAARVTESGFAIAFQCPDKETAQGRAKELLDNLRYGLSLPEDGAYGVFKLAMYNLETEDRNCESILFNLRRNCSGILGEEKQIVLCGKHEMNDVLEEKELIRDIEHGLKNNEFRLFVQFIVDNNTKKIVSAEGLARWQNKEKGLIGPGGFIGIMTRTGLIAEFDYYMLEQICRELEKWQNSSLKGISLSCNFSRITLSEEGFVDKVSEIIGRYSFDRSLLVMEITEEALEKNLEQAMKNVKECKKLGVGVALDDLGSGYTSLVNLCEYPIDVVKIDREILLRSEKLNGKDLLSGIIALAHKLNLKVVCEGVESKEQYNFVKESECDYTQGWFFSRAIPTGDAEEFARHFSATC